MTAPQTAEDMTELVDAQIDRVDLVGKAANGTSFLLRKAADDGLLQPLVAPDQVRDLIAKADAQEGTVTDPAPDADVAKDAPPVETGDLVETAAGGSTAESLPGSPDWENLDGDTAMNAVATLGRVKACLAWLSDREAQEAVTGDDPRDGDNAWDLDDMACAIDYMIGRLAGFAVGEHMEADMADELEQVGKAVAGVAAPLAVLEGFVPLAKAGRTLSGANEAKIRTAVDSLTEVLNSLPAAPAADGVTKTEETPTVTEPTAPEAPAAEESRPAFLGGAHALAKAIEEAPTFTAAQTFATLADGGSTVDLHKAKGDPQMAVFSADGKLVGVIDPADLNPIAATEAPSAGDTEGTGDDAAAEPAPDAPAAPAAQPDEQVIPGTDTVQAPAPAPEDDQTPAVAKAVAQALKEAFAPFAEQVAKSADLAKAYDDLKERVEKMGAQPDNRRSPVLNGGTGTAGAVTRDAPTEGGLADLKKAIDAEPDPVKKAELSKSAFFATLPAAYDPAHAAGVKARFQG